MDAPEQAQTKGYLKNNKQPEVIYLRELTGFEGVAITNVSPCLHLLPNYK